jgi:hypothetical protein
VVDLAGDVVRDRAPRLIAAAAERTFATLPGAPGGLAAGAPELVRTPSGAPSYWLVPGTTGDGVQAVARVLLDGRVATVAVSPHPSRDAAAIVTGMSETEASTRAPAGAIGAPTLVHDGPIGREAWLHRTRGPEGLERWVFTTAGGSYERPAGQPLSGPPAERR